MCILIFMKNDNEKLKHSTAHVLAAAVLEMFPETKFGMGPATEDGFFYDFDLPRTLIPEDLEILEEKMKKIIKENHPFEKADAKISDVEKDFIYLKQDYKVEIINDLKKEGEKKVSVYRTGDFVDLCKGPHLKSTKEINPQAFKLIRISGAYWKSDENREQLQRIYGVVFNDKKELKEYLHQQEEAKKRDHRKLGEELGLFVFSETVGKGLPLWTEKGATIRRELERFIQDEEIKRGYKHVSTPDIAKLDLYKKSGHYPYYKDSMYSPIEIDKEKFMLRPMSCPHHFELYLSQKRSYRELPIRIAELAKLYRYEKSGELSGLVRVRGFCLADAHIICADEKQAAEEIEKALDLIEYAAEVLGLKMGENYWYRLSLGNREDEKKYFKDDKAWDKAEKSLRDVLNKRKGNFVEAENEAAFYGPKIDIQMKNVSGKEDTAFTVQYDFVMPKRFELNYVAKDGKEKEAIVIHRSSIGAIERIIAFLIEHHAGALPAWLSPTQVSIITVSEKFNKYAEEVAEKLRDNKVRIELNNRDESLGKRIREEEKQKVPYILVVGEKEMKDSSVNVRTRGEKEQKTIKLASFIKNITKEIVDKK